MRESAVYEPLNASELESLQRVRDQLFDRVVSKGDDPNDSKRNLFLAAAFTLELGRLPISTRSDAEAFAILLGDNLVSGNRHSGNVQWFVQSHASSRTLVLRGMENGRAISIPVLADYLQKETNLSYFKVRLDGYLSGLKQIDDPISTIDDIECRCGNLCRSDSFRRGPVTCERCKLKWYVAILDVTGHFESEIENPDTKEIVSGALTRIVFPEGQKCCWICGEVYDPAQYDACPSLFSLALSMIETRGEELEIPPSAKALNYLIERKSQLRTFWITLKSNLSDIEIRNFEQLLARVGLLAEIQ